MPRIIGLFFLLGASACATVDAPALENETARAESTAPLAAPLPAPTDTPTPKPVNRLSIDWMREQKYPASDLVIEQTLTAGSNYKRFIASYQSEGLKIFGLLTVPNGAKPNNGFPVIIFNHGYIPPAAYRTTERYVDYVDAFARNGYVVFKPDYRGHGNSEGIASGGYGSPDYTIDVLHALATLKQYKDADPNRIGMWGHSMGGQITLRSLVISKDIKAAVIWAGVVASYADIIESWRAPSGGGFAPGARGWRGSLMNEYGTPQENPEFWNSISPNAYVADIVAPVQLHHSVDDSHVPARFSESLAQQLKRAQKPIEYYPYAGDDHNLAKSFSRAMQRSLAWFDQYVKGK